MQDALARIDQHHGEIGGGGAGRHVAGVLLVAGRVGDDELALGGGEEAIGDIDGDALLALGLQAIDQQREIDVLAGGAVLGAGIAFQRGQLVFEDQLGVVEQAADQRRLAVIDRAAGQEAQQRLLLLLVEIVRSCCRDDVGSWSACSSEISFALLLFHRAGFVLVDEAALALGGPGGQHFAHDVLEAAASHLDGAGQRIAAQRAEADQAVFDHLVRAAAACARHRP